MKSGGDASSMLTPKLSLEREKRAQQLVGFRLKAQIHIDRRLTPAFEHSCRTSGEIDPNGLTRDAPELDGDALRPAPCALRPAPCAPSDDDKPDSR
jgi:hypothetical protein